MGLDGSALVFLAAAAIESAREKLNTSSDSWTAAVLPVGEPERAIVREAARCGATLIIVGSHGRRGLSRLLLGSVAEKVVREAPCSVLVVRE